MMEVTKFKRNANFSIDEKKILSELVLKYQNWVENKRTDATTNAHKIKGWKKIAREFNAVSINCPRNASSLKTCWENIKRQTKKHHATQKKEFFLTGGGKAPPPPPSEGAEKIVEAVLGPALEGFDNEFDSDSFPIHISQLKVSVVSSDTNPENDEKKLEGPEVVENEYTNHRNEVHNSEGPEAIENEWSNWTPQSLKRPISDKLKQCSSKCLKKRRQNEEPLPQQLLLKKIELVETLIKNANQEAELKNQEAVIKLQILEEQLKQEKIKTEKLQ